MWKQIGYYDASQFKNDAVNVTRVSNWPESIPDDCSLLMVSCRWGDEHYIPHDDGDALIEPNLFDAVYMFFE